MGKTVLLHRQAQSLECDVSARLRGAVEHDQEFFAAETVELVGAAEIALHELADEEEDLIAVQVAVAVVDRFEMIDIEKREPARLAGAGIGGRRLAQSELAGLGFGGLGVKKVGGRMAVGVMEEC